MSNDPDRATHTLTISGIVQPRLVPAITVQETAIDFGTVEAAQTVQKTFTVKNTGTAPLEIIGIESDDVSGLTFEPSVFTLSPNGSQHDYGDVSEFDGGRVFGEYQYSE